MFKRKWLWIIPVILAVVAVVGGFVASGSIPGGTQGQVAAAEPEQGDERGVDTLVEPTYPPPSQAGQAESTAQEGGEPRIVSSTQVVPLQNIWHRSTLWPAYKSGDDAVGKGRSECSCAGCWFPLEHNVTVTLWKAQPGEKWEEAATEYMGSCCPPRCDIYAYARYEDAETAWYCTTSRHVGTYMGEYVWIDELDTSDNPQWLVF
jgi:hypothetical protein